MSMRRSTFPRSEVLVLGPNSVQSLVPSTLISQVESLLDSHRIEDAIALADQQRKKLNANTSVDEDEADELCYVYQRIGFQCFAETLFEDAGKNLFSGNLDPRLLVSYYPHLRGSLFSTEDAADVFAGVVEHMPGETSVDDIIATNLVRNYSPHLSPNTRSAPPTAELRKILVMAANEMLEAFLRKCRAKRVDEAAGNATGKASYAIVDTVLAKLLARSEKTTELYALFHEPNDVVLSEIEPVLKETGQYNALCVLYKQRGNDIKLLEIWSKLADGEWSDDDIKDPLSDMVTLLREKRDRTLTQEWGIWLTKRDPERGLKLLMPRETGKRREKSGDDISLLQQIRDANPAAGAQFLEYLVLQKRNISRSLHTQLAMTCVDHLFAALADASVSKLWRAKASSYASSCSESSFLSYFASTTPGSDHKRVRLKTVLFLQGSTLYDAGVIRSRLLEHEKVLKLELAIVDGKLGNHRSALAILVHDLRDASSAEAYCTLGGDVVPGKIAQSIAEKSELQQWGAMFSPPTSIAKSGLAKSIPMGKQKSVDEEVKKGLLKVLLEVYMSDDAIPGRAARLLNSQAMNLDVLDVVSLVPPHWPLNVMSSFLARSFRRTLHARHEGQIMKKLSAGQNLEVKDRTWLVIREEGMVVEEAAEGSEGSNDDHEETYDKKGILAEKVAIQLQADPALEISGLDHNGEKLESPWPGQGRGTNVLHNG